MEIWNDDWNRRKLSDGLPFIKLPQLKIISLHIRSMWETICDAVASWSDWKFGSKIPVYPILGFGHQLPPPPKIEM